jgi:hypothetical protein
MMPNVDEEEDKKVPPTHSRVQVPSTQVLDQVDSIVQPQIQVQDNHTQPPQAPQDVPQVRRERISKNHPIDQIICSPSKGAMQEELNNFTRNDVWVLEPPPKNKNNIGTKWVFRNKEDKYGLMVHNKARLVAKDVSQVEGNLRCPYGELQAKQDTYDH